ncbi:MAG: hypothetical protein ACRCX2_20185 [Paraclostridium sp.]
MLLELIKKDDKNINTMSICINKSEFIELKKQYQNFVLLNNYDKILIKYKQSTVIKQMVKLFYSSVCKMLNNPKVIEILETKEIVKVQIYKTSFSKIESHRKVLDAVLELFSNNLAVKVLGYNDSQCDIDIKLIP